MNEVVSTESSVVSSESVVNVESVVVSHAEYVRAVRAELELGIFRPDMPTWAYDRVVASAIRAGMITLADMRRDVRTRLGVRALPPAVGARVNESWHRITRVVTPRVAHGRIASVAEALAPTRAEQHAIRKRNHEGRIRTWVHSAFDEVGYNTPSSRWVGGDVSVGVSIIWGNEARWDVVPQISGTITKVWDNRRSGPRSGNNLNVRITVRWDWFKLPHKIWDGKLVVSATPQTAGSSMMAVRVGHQSRLAIETRTLYVPRDRWERA